MARKMSATFRQKSVAELCAKMSVKKFTRLVSMLTPSEQKRFLRLAQRDAAGQPVDPTTGMGKGANVAQRSTGEDVSDPKAASSGDVK